LKKHFFISLFAAIVLASLLPCQASLGSLDGKMILMIIASRDFRDEEYITPRKALESEGAKVLVASSTLAQARGSSGATVKPDLLLQQVRVEAFDAIIFVGGPGAKEYWDNGVAHYIARQAVNKNKVIGAICIAPVTLARAGILKGKHATVWGDLGKMLKDKGAIYTNRNVVADKNIITANGPSASMDFARTIIKVLKTNK